MKKLFTISDSISERLTLEAKEQRISQSQFIEKVLENYFVTKDLVKTLNEQFMTSLSALRSK